LEQNINYVKQWIDTELLFQEALRRKIHKDPLIKKRLEKMRKDLLAAELMSRNSMQYQGVIIDDATIKNYYELNKEKYVREKDVAKYVEILVQDYKIAWNITRNGNVDNFLKLAAEHSQAPYPKDGNIPYTPIEEIQPEIRNAILVTPVNSVSNPIKTEDGYYVILVIDKLEKGGICKLEEIKDEIVNQLTVKNQKEKIEQFLSDLRLKTNVEFNSELIKSLYNQRKQINKKEG
ncbi:MAG: peptidyl-prolyl cis-trans isomerase, partial [Chitinispirillaceae bacterium]|nr:peptidyl-prolyl cis-trans isomerase [Chitinispirillaceae bacterium]